LENIVKKSREEEEDGERRREKRDKIEYKSLTVIKLLAIDSYSSFRFT